MSQLAIELAAALGIPDEEGELLVEDYESILAQPREWCACGDEIANHLPEDFTSTGCKWAVA